ncbi:MAG: hypothetical protein WC533_04400 [Candidatus Pacearchaeota archaeon]
MGAAAVKIKIMPNSPDADLNNIESKAVKIIEGKKGRIASKIHEPIAFGLKAILITFAWTEDADRDALEVELNKIKDVSSAEIIDFRRAFG